MKYKIYLGSYRSHTKHSQNFIKILFLLAFSATLVFTPFEVSKTEAATSNLPKEIGDKELKNPNYYEEAERIDQLVDLAEASELFEYTKPIQGFSIKTKNKKVFDKVYVKAGFVDGSYSNFLIISENDELDDADANGVYFSDLFTFDKDISSVEVVNPDNLELSIEEIDLSKNEKEMMATIDNRVIPTDSGFYASEAAEIEYKTKFFAGLGFSSMDT